MAERDVQLEEGLERLEHIEEDLEEIKNQSSPSRWIAFRNGIWQGAGAIIGSILAVLLLGWILSLFGFIPGFGVIGERIHDAMSQLRR